VQAAVADPNGPATVNICPGTYFETVTINRNLTLNGAGDGPSDTSNTILDGDSAGSVVTIATAGATVSLRKLRLTGGNAESGGGIQSFKGGSLTLSSCTVSGNAAAFGGGIDSESPSSSTTPGTLTLINSIVSGNRAGQLGGGIFVDGHMTVNLTASSVISNTAEQEGGGIATDDIPITMTLTNSEVKDNTGLNGGGIFNTANLTLNGSTVGGNHAVAPPDAGTLHGDGGGIFNAGLGTMTLDSASEVTLNEATHEGGGIANHGMVNCGDPGSVSGNSAGTAGTENCFDDGGSGCGGCNP
jgi:predicted outer membrane repeat protein